MGPASVSKDKKLKSQRCWKMIKVNEQLLERSTFLNVVLTMWPRSWKSMHLWQMLPAKVENDFQLRVKIGIYYKFPKQIEAKVAISYYRSLHSQMEYRFQSLLFVEDSWMLNIVGTPTNGNIFEMHHKEKFASTLQMIIWLGSLTIGNE